MLSRHQRYEASTGAGTASTIKARTAATSDREVHILCIAFTPMLNSLHRGMSAVSGFGKRLERREQAITATSDGAALLRRTKGTANDSTWPPTLSARERFVARLEQELREARDAASRAREADSPLLWHRSPHTAGGYSGGGLGGAMRALFRRAGVRTATGRPSRTHDFRHGFAVNALLRWYRAGVDVQTKLPFLAAYMGHVSIVSTAYYLQFVELLASAASARFADHCGTLIAGPFGAGGAR